TYRRLILAYALKPAACPHGEVTVIEQLKLERGASDVGNEDIHGWE
ncbi:MAG: hypothetical protein HOH43_22970, partial [Candidatus Latescibacteria bacterium]|nr:hypothetical protein [Candidatus Latescibacterota bacterium]